MDDHAAPASVLVPRSGFPHVPGMLAAILPEVVVTQCDDNELADAVAEADVLVPLLAPVSRRVFERGRRLRLVQQWGSGLDRVDLDAAHEFGVPVRAVDTSTTGSADAVAEWCVMAAIALGRQALTKPFPTGKSWGSPVGRSVRGSEAVLIGMGAVGRSLAPLLQTLGAAVTVISASYGGDLPGVTGLGYDRLTDALGRADWVFICLRRQRQLGAVLGAPELRSIRPGAFLVNASRGHLVDEHELELLLRAGHIAGAALDVFEYEPLTGAEGILTAPGLLASPHVAGVVDVIERQIAGKVHESIRQALQEGDR